MPDDPKPNSLALDLMRRATVGQIKEDASELAALTRKILQPVPLLSPEPAEREVVLAASLFEARDNARRLLALIAESDLRFYTSDQ